MLPSTFTSKDEEEEKLYKKVKARLEMAKFLLQTRDSLKTQTSKFDKNFKDVMEDIKKGQPVSKEQVYKFVTLFKDDLTLANIRRSQIQAMCRFIGIRPIGPTDFLRGQLSSRIDSLKTDDKLIKSEGLQSLTLIELKQAVAARGMSSYGPRKQLESLMEEWLDLSLNQKVPTALLILSRAYRLLPHQDPEQLLRATLTKVPEKFIEEVEVEAEFASPTVDPGEDPLQAKLDLLKEERKKLKEEAANEEAIASEVAGQHTPLDAPSAPAEANVVVDDLSKVVQASDVLDALANPVADEKAELQNLGAQLLEQELLTRADEKKSTAAENPANVEKNVKLDPIEQKLKEMVKQIDDEIKEAEAKIIPSFDTDGDGVVTKEEMRTGLEKLGTLSPEDIETIVAKLDADKTGVVHLDQITAVSHLEADVVTMAKLVEVEEKKRLDTLREKVEDIIEEEKEKDILKANLENENDEDKEMEAEIEKPTKLDEVSENEKKLVEEVLRKGATAPPVTPLPPTKEEVIEAQSEHELSENKDKDQNEKDEAVAEVFKAVAGEAEAKQTKKKDIEQ